MFRLIPRETKFFELFAELSTSLTTGARLLHAILEDPHDLKERVKQMQAIEHEGDRATHAIIAKLNTTFITPFDREDIHRLASSLDDVLDFVNSAAVRLVMYKITQPPEAAAELAGLIVLQAADCRFSAIWLQQLASQRQNLSFRAVVEQLWEENVESGFRHREC